MGGLFYFKVPVPLPLEECPKQGQEKVQNKLYNCDHLNGVYQLMVFLPGEYRIWLPLLPRKIRKIDDLKYTIVSVKADLFLNSNFCSFVKV